MATRQPPPKGQDAAAPPIAVRGVIRSFGATKALDGLDLQVDPLLTFLIFGSFSNFVGESVRHRPKSA